MFTDISFKKYAIFNKHKFCKMWKIDIFDTLIIKKSFKILGIFSKWIWTSLACRSTPLLLYCVEVPHSKYGQSEVNPCLSKFYGMVQNSQWNRTISLSTNFKGIASSVNWYI